LRPQAPGAIMIVDVHSHAWHYPDHFSQDFRFQARRARAGVEVDLTVHYEEYREQATDETKTIVFGGKAKLSGLWVDDSYVAQYVESDPGHLIGFLSVDPTQEGWDREMREGHLELGLRGMKLNPFWEYAQSHNLPVLLHTGTTFISRAPLDVTFPRWLDPVAMRFPDVKVILAHLGHPYEHECVAVIRKHPNLYSDISGLHYRPLQLYHSLMLVQEYGVWDKILFGSDYPFTTVKATLDGLRHLNAMLEGTSFPRLDEEQMEAMIHRDSLMILGLK
jgi:predicted TIM-barrel fold metal-dependent hydrolase